MLERRSLGSAAGPRRQAEGSGGRSGGSGSGAGSSNEGEAKDRPDLRLVEGAEVGMPVATIGEAWEEEQAEAQNGLLASQVSLLECLASGSATSPALIAARRVAKARYAERQAQRAASRARSSEALAA